MTLSTSWGILPVLGLFALVQLYSTGSSGTSTSTSGFFILPNSNTPSPMRPYYTLLQVVDNPSKYFTSNTTVGFPPGSLEVSAEGQLVIQNVNNISLVGDNDNSTMIKCVGQFGLAFINITNLTVSKLSLSMCGAPMSIASQMTTSLSELVYEHDSLTFSQVSFISSIYLSHITHLTAIKLGISHSKSVGFLGLNIFGMSSIQEAVFVNNTPNCVIAFLDSYSPVETADLYITDSFILLGTRGGGDHAFNKFAGGLNIIATMNMYQVKSYVRNITVYGNTGSMSGNILLRINCEVEIQATQVNCSGGHPYGLFLKYEGNSTNCKSEVIFHMSHSYFSGNGNGASLYFLSITYSVCVKLENITAEHHVG